MMAKPATPEDAELLDRDLKLHGISIADDKGRRIDPHQFYFRPPDDRTHGPESAIDD